MAWKQIQGRELALIVRREIEHMGADARGKFSQVRIPPRRLACRRSEQYGDEWLIAVARLGNRVIVFDDVEDEFGIAELCGNPPEVLHDWRLVGTLECALKEAFLHKQG